MVAIVSGSSIAGASCRTGASKHGGVWNFFRRFFGGWASCLSGGFENQDVAVVQLDFRCFPCWRLVEPVWVRKLGKHLDQSSRVTCVADYFGPTNLLTMEDFPSKMSEAQAAPDHRRVVILTGIRREPKGVAKVPKRPATGAPHCVQDPSCVRS
jgi:hypothetical protein